MGDSVYAIDGFPDDDRLWRIEWIGGVGYNTSVPSEPQIDVSLAQLPKGERNPLSARARSSQVEKRTVKIGVGLLPYIWIGSVWQKRRPVITNLSAYRSRVSIDTTSNRGRGRDSSRPPPPAQTRAGAASAHGSYLEYLASNRPSGNGCRIRTSGIWTTRS